MEKIIRIGTQNNELALWRANIVAKQLEHIELKTEIVNVEAIDISKLDMPVFKEGTTNMFTKKLDLALLNDQIDIAVHDLSKVPTVLPEGIIQVAVLKRGNFNDVLVLKTNDDFFTNKIGRIATNSERCKSQWLYRYPNHKVTLVQGDIMNRLQHLKENDLDGSIFSMSALKRMDLLPEEPFKLGWMVPAPAQGTVMISALKKNKDIVDSCKELNDMETEICTTIEREFLRVLDEDLTSPVGALATVKEEELKFRGTIFSPDGKNKIEFSKEVPLNHTTDIAEFAAKLLLDKGAKKILRKIGDVQKEINIFSTKNLSLGQTSELNQNIGITMSDFVTIKFNRLKPAIVKNTLEHVIIPNQNSVDAILDSFDSSQLNFKNIYCIGRRTKRLIEKRIGKVTHSENSEEKLAKYLAEHLPAESNTTYFCGNRRSNTLPDHLTKNKKDLNEIVCYKTILSSNKIEENINAIIFYSPLDIESYLQQNTATDIPVFCVGEATTLEAKKHFKNITTAKIPTAESVLKSVNEFFTEN